MHVLQWNRADLYIRFDSQLLDMRRYGLGRVGRSSGNHCTKTKRRFENGRIMLKFDEKDHSYTGNNIAWTGVTTFISKFKEPFDAVRMSELVSKKKGSPWHGLPPAEIREHWKRKSDTSLETGHWYHLMKENETHAKGSALVRGMQVPVIAPVMEGTIKVAPTQVLKDGIYPEHLCYMESVALCGQADIVTVSNGFVDIDDYKTSKSIDKKGYVDREGSSKKMLKPIDNLDDCNFIHYALQLSTYMYMVLRHNPKLKPGKMIVHHVVFDEDEEGKFKERNIKLDSAGNPIVLKVELVEVPYLKSHVQAMIAHKKNSN